MPLRLALAFAAVAVLAAGQASAHAKVVSSNPAENATVASPPQIILRFNEKLQPRFSSFELTAGKTVAPVKVTVSQDKLSLVGTPTRRLPPGTYEVKWRAVTADTHRVQGAYTFTVR